MPLAAVDERPLGYGRNLHDAGHDRAFARRAPRGRNARGAARRLQAMGLIRYARGHILLGDRGAIEAGACECYRTVAGGSRSAMTL
ncbi:MAG: hypothetical protein JWO24_825 [Rhodospirillales bacterium]|nr:hypothetical protein [Rhodospirillales bacterium]